MKTLIIYDSYFGNTEKIAKIIHSEFKKDAEICKASDFKMEMLDNTELLIAGSPTRAFRPTENITNLIKTIPNGSLNCTKIATFDTRANLEKVNSKVLTFLVKIFGYAAKPLEKQLVKKGGIPVMETIGFLVEESEGPLTKGENDRAREWTRELIKKL